MKHKNHLWVGNYYYNIYENRYAKDNIKFIVGYKSREYQDEEGGQAWEMWPSFWEVSCRSCIKKLLSTKENKEEIRDTDRNPEGIIATLAWGKDFTPETWLLPVNLYS